MLSLYQLALSLVIGMHGRMVVRLLMVQTNPKRIRSCYKSLKCIKIGHKSMDNLIEIQCPEDISPAPSWSLATRTICLITNLTFLLIKPLALGYISSFPKVFLHCFQRNIVHCSYGQNYSEAPNVKNARR